MKSAPLAKVPATTTPDTGGRAESVPNGFVFNLVSSTTPVALTRPDHAGLKRFTFFVSRRREEGRERFRLHMGYFDTQDEAEQLLDIVRSIYPGAWVGLAPSSRAVSRAASAPAPASAPAQLPARSNRAGAAAAARPSTAASGQTLALVPDEGRQPLADVTDASEGRTAARSLGNVRDAIASLDDGAEPPTVSPIPELAPAVIPTVRPIGAAASPGPTSEEVAGDKGAVLTSSAVLRVLEGKEPPRRAPPESKAQLRTQSRTEQRAEPRAERPYYAVQLLWAVKPIDLAQVPQLAIFSAYVLYGAEGNRDGRRWYGLRLGFFSDTVSAKQVAQYVRADFATVSVVPVTGRERDQAMQAKASRVEDSSKGTAPGKRAVTRTAPKKNEFEFIEDAARASPRSKTSTALRAGARAIPVGRPAARADSGAKQSAAALRTPRVAAAKGRKPGQIQANARAKPKTLEETLDILGANQLQVDDEPGALIHEGGVRHLDMQVSKAKPSKLSRLFGRLSERLGD